MASATGASRHGCGSVREHGESFGEGKQEKQKPRLPKIQPNINKRAQCIIKAHMHAVDTVSSLLSAPDLMPVLAQLDSTAPSTAITHDISHLCDQATCLRPLIPPSLIAEEDHVFDSGFLPKDSTSVYSEADGMWHTKSFPSASPSSREDAVMLDAWITKALEYGGAATTGNASGTKELARAVEDLVPILSTALHEMVRQVMHHCPERGKALEKIWKTYVELFDRVLQQLQMSLFHQKQKTAEVSEVLQKRRKELRRLRKEHPEKLRKIIEDLEHKFTTRHKSAEDELVQAESDNAKLKDELRAHQKELELWYPGFSLYEDSHVKKLVPQTQRSLTKGNWRTATNASTQNFDASVDATDADTQATELMPAEVAIAEDFKRLLAVLAPEKRKHIGTEIGPVMQVGIKDTKFKKSRSKAGTDLMQKTQTENVDRLHGEVQEQEAYMVKLREEIAELEARQAKVADGESVVSPSGEEVKSPKDSPKDKSEDDEDQDDTQ